MSSFESKQIENHRWFAHEVLKLWRTSRDFGAVRDVISFLDEFDRNAFISHLFWRGLRSRDWDLASACVREGYIVRTVEPGIFGPLDTAIAVLGDQPSAIEWLLDHGAEIERRGRNHFTPLHAAVMALEINVALVLLARGAVVDAKTGIDNDETPLIIAAGLGSSEMVTLLLEYRADPQIKDRWGDDAASRAEKSGHQAIARAICAACGKETRATHD